MNEQTMKTSMTLRLIYAIALLFCLLVPAGETRAAFTGIIDMKMTMPNGRSDITFFLGLEDQRMDMISEMEKIPEPLRTTVITRQSAPDEAIIVNHKAGTWSRINLQSAVENATYIDFDTDYRIDNAGTAIISGLNCQHIRLFSSTEKIELWLTKDIGNFETFRLLQSQNPRLSNSKLSKKLALEGLDGFPVKMVQENENGMTTMQISSWQEASLQASEFEIPEGYTEVRDSSQPLDTLQKEHLRNLMDKIKQFRE
ncbi:DUF4412 domain-containing protein [Prosthecochloris sp. HL-130-GSB]|jgi:hypothetical protein|uniref:DUF4412 domain-containing protein n=1 Tax=Prosthecochloris sp. HL-130-GSB TaxID=1974213 RepID=UPI001E4D9EF6|nr:DUF4412 domain-containing protein [Prosthecochloris sp. HL-130-GSB]